MVPGTARGLATVVMDKVNESDDTKVSYVHEDKNVHYVTRPDSDLAPEGLTYIVVTRQVERRVPFLFLLQLEKMFQQQYLDNLNETVENLKSSNSLVPDMRQLVVSTEKGENDPTGLAKTEIDQVKNIMVENVERLLERGERINLLVSKTDRMNNSAQAFRRRTVAVRRSMWWKNVKLAVLLGVIIMTVIYFLMGELPTEIKFIRYR